MLPQPGPHRVMLETMLAIVAQDITAVVTETLVLARMTAESAALLPDSTICKSVQGECVTRRPSWCQ